MPSSIKKVHFTVRSNRKCGNTLCGTMLKQNVVNRKPTARLCFPCGTAERFAIQRAKEAERKRHGL